MASRSAALSMHRASCMEGRAAAQSVRPRVCIDVNQLPSNSDCEGDSPKEAPPFIFEISLNTQASANGQSCADCDQESGSMQPKPMKISCFEHGRALRCVAQHPSEGRGGAQIAFRKHWLSKDKLVILEERFKKHTNLDAKQKIALAKQLNLRPRQVEVWFQNRRAKNKVMQIEEECMVLRRCCEVLAKENRQLQKEIVELRALTMGGQYVIPHGFYMHFPKTTLTMDSLGKFLTTSSGTVALAASTTSSIGSLNQPSNIPTSTLSTYHQPSPPCS